MTKMKKALCIALLSFAALTSVQLYGQKYVGNNGVTVLYSDRYDSKNERIRTASEMVSPIPSNTVAARSLSAASMRA